MIRVITDLECFKKLEREWDLLYNERFDYMPFLSFLYNYLSWVALDSKDRTLYIVCYYAEQQETACAIFPFCIDAHKCLRFINDIHTDYQTALISNKMRTNYVMYEEVFKVLMNDTSFNRLFLDHIMSNDMLLPYFGHFNRNVKIYRTENYSYFNVQKLLTDKSYIDSLRHLTSKERNRLKNIDKKLVDVEFRILQINNGDEYPEKTVEELVSIMIANGIRTDDYFSPSLKRFIRDVYVSGLLTIALITESGNVCSLSFFYKCDRDNHLIQWMILYRDKKYNLWNKLKIFEYMYNNGGGVFNFGRGAYPYKIQHFRPVIQNLFCIDLSKSDFLRYNLQVKENFHLLKTMFGRAMRNLRYKK